MGKLIIGFVFGLLACVWTYGLDPTEAVFGFSNKIAIVHDEVQEEYQVDSRHGHKGSTADTISKPPTLHLPLLIG